MPLRTEEFCLDLDVISSVLLSSPNDLSRSSKQITSESTSTAAMSSVQIQQNIKKYNMPLIQEH